MQIIGTRHAIIVREPGYIDIGCMHMTLTDWRDRYAAVGRAEKYSDVEIAEYKMHIEHCAAWMAHYGMLDVMVPEAAKETV